MSIILWHDILNSKFKINHRIQKIILSGHQWVNNKIIFVKILDIIISNEYSYYETWNKGEKYEVNLLIKKSIISV